MLEVLYAAGLRVSKLVELRLFEVSLNDGLVRVMGKGSKGTARAFGTIAAEWITRYIREGGRCCSRAKAATRCS